MFFGAAHRSTTRTQHRVRVASLLRATAAEGRTASPGARGKSLALALPLALLASIACTAPTSASPEEADASYSVSSLVVIERTVTEEGAARTTSVARFFRGALDERVVRALGAGLELPAVGTCQDLVEGNGGAGAMARGVELEEAGSVTLEVSEKSLVLSPRWVPDPIGRVRGTLYSGAWSDADLAGGITVRSSNFGDSATFVAPRDLSGVSIAGNLAGVVAAGTNEITWNTGDTPRDLIYADVTSEAGRTRCAFADTGRARISLPAGSGTLSVHRLYLDVRRSAIEVRYDTQVSVTFSAR